ncbi:alpha/beta hydrolase family protein [Streptomonospora nanhaiensis]|uniref:Poly(ethylene terephthalate) hydrolase n=1 Tax=Streptomonospora nanhaiensis TaxID=1323731 RepID=A0A853BQM0_9ACTN|nr:dienelactone hydrolase family protein [Streptomonospora nanhaiensis]MBX9387838.1 dienelactone hydrolase family protein [Streptomonospora nanhaiensis]NYI97300.1 esterase/lipase [Streptomonospora nanhaiensis]
MFARTTTPDHAAPESAPRTTAAQAAGRVAAVLALALGGISAVAAPAQAQENPYERGPDPTERSIEALRGPFPTAEEDVSSLVPGFGGGTIYYPTDDSEGDFGAVVVAPGYTASSTSMAWIGPRLASQGFVVFTIDTNTRYDQPADRGEQIGAALDYLVEDSDVADIIDPDRLGAMGHSMGGGGTLEIAADRPELQAAIPLTPWNLDKSWGEVQVPTMIIGAENDTIASVTTHSIPFYNSLSGSLDKAYLELNGASHFAPNTNNTTIAKYSIAWLKRFIDNDMRYEQFLCPAPGPDLDISEYRDTCPHSS